MYLHRNSLTSVINVYKLETKGSFIYIVNILEEIEF